MIRDLYFRFKDMVSMKAFFRRVEVQNMISDLFTDHDDANRMLDLRRNVAFVIMRPDTVVITPATYDGFGNELTPVVLDSRPWILLRLLGNTADDDGSGSHWTVSRLIKFIRDNGVAGVKRGVRMSRWTFQGKWVEIYHTGDLMALDIVPHVIAGGPKWVD